MKTITKLFNRLTGTRRQEIIDESFDPHQQYRELMQAFEDSRIEMDIKRYVLHEFKAWLNASIIEVGDHKVRNYMLMWCPAAKVGHYTIHHEPTAKHKYTNFTEMCQREFEKLKKEYAHA